jgi:hypothetical protein
MLSNFVLADVPTVGLYAGWVFAVITGLLVLAGLVLAAMAISDNRKDLHPHARLGPLPAVAAFGCALVVGAITLWAMWPLKYEYHHYVSKRGTVETISKRIISGGNGRISERVIVKMQDDPFPYGVDDTRAVLLKTGDPVAIKCKREHQFFQPYEQNGWACRWGA